MMVIGCANSADVVGSKRSGGVPSPVRNRSLFVGSVEDSDRQSEPGKAQERRSDTVLDSLPVITFPLARNSTYVGKMELDRFLPFHMNDML